ncbi:uncharacterized protein I303_102795 [Kwoniella dejecticola CBS 10117]|uniref:Ubiquinol-cytochrome c chaperone domain-containing protein n=1 Tax=Kwoniella dejecticola CBS 10117 TaxID=1296121 RepID=A0A1A6A9R0_9TREE|nr:uncharacterized protein I303_02810 [Kwoniella dejecticola CBS 10117]OBR86795.1 hypothetical protein I303_02810 [Kwoniella dejecticola CBS 10117]
MNPTIRNTSASLLPLLSKSSRSATLALPLHPLSIRYLSTTPHLLVQAGAGAGAGQSTATATANATEPARPPHKHIANPKFVTDRPVKLTHKPVFPAPHNPFAPPPAQKTYNDLTLKVLRRVNKLLGYNRRRRTTARESGRMMKGIVEAVEADQEFWYGECDLPRTFHTFFTIHYLYVLLTLVRLRALPNYIANPLSPLPQSAYPGLPGTTTPLQRPSIIDTLDNLGCYFSRVKQHDYRYQQTLLTHFFNIVENEIRLMLGVEITREGETMKRLREYQERGNFARISLDYVLGLTKSDEPKDREIADAELASFVWRFIFARRGTGKNLQGELVYPEGEGMKRDKELEMSEQIEQIVKFIRREVARLDTISDRDVIAGNVGLFSKVRQ